MSDNFTLPGSGLAGYVPSLHELAVEFSRDPKQFPLNRYINYRKFDKMTGYYLRVKSDNYGRVVRPSDFQWPLGTDRPATITATDATEFLPFICERHITTRTIPQEAVDQAAFDMQGMAVRSAAQQLMTLRCYNVHNTLTTSGNWGSNYATATTLGGGVWSSATTANPYIRNSLIAAAIAVQKSTYSAIDLKDMYLVMNPNTAKTVQTSQEFLDFVKQQPGSVQIWEAQEQYRLYGLPETLIGVNVVVDNTVYTGGLPDPTATPSFAFTFPDNYAVLLSKQNAISPAAGGSFSTFELFVFEDFSNRCELDVKNRRYDIDVIENVDTSSRGLVAPQAGYLIATNS